MLQGRKKGDKEALRKDGRKGGSLALMIQERKRKWNKMYKYLKS